MGGSSFVEDPIAKRPVVASSKHIVRHHWLLLHSSSVAKPSYAAYTWSPVDAEILIAPFEPE
jgi:hypothetical protein